jgi:hypothetical protein
VELYLHSPSTSSWRGAWLSTGTTSPLPLTLPLPLPYSEANGNQTGVNEGLFIFFIPEIFFFGAAISF